MMTCMVIARHIILRLVMKCRRLSNIRSLTSNQQSETSWSQRRRSARQVQYGTMTSNASTDRRYCCCCHVILNIALRIGFASIRDTCSMTSADRFDKPMSERISTASKHDIRGCRPSIHNVQHGSAVLINATRLYYQSTRNAIDRRIYEHRATLCTTRTCGITFNVRVYDYNY